MAFKANMILGVEKFLTNMPDSIITLSDLQKETNIEKNTLKEILLYLDKINKVLITKKGIIWIENNDKNLSNDVRVGMEL